jgi:sugar-specific transcriptional regulator TrmB
MEKEIEILKELGFTEYEAKIYLVLLSYKKADAKTLSKETGIQETKVYQIAKNLIQNGMAKMISGHPVMFEIIDPSLSFSKILEEFEKKKEDVKKLIENLKQTYETNQKLGEEEIATYMNFEVLKKELKRLHDSAKKEICMYSRFEKVDEELTESLEKAVKRKVDVKVVGAVKDQTSELNAYTYKKIGCLVKTLPSNDYAPVSFSLIDEETGHLLIRSESNPSNYVDIIIKNKNLVKMFRNLFDYYWKKGKSLQ